MVRSLFRGVGCAGGGGGGTSFIKIGDGVGDGSTAFKGWTAGAVGIDDDDREGSTAFPGNGAGAFVNADLSLSLFSASSEALSSIATDEPGVPSDWVDLWLPQWLPPVFKNQLLEVFKGELDFKVISGVPSDRVDLWPPSRLPPEGFEVEFSFESSK